MFRVERFLNIFELGKWFITQFSFNLTSSFNQLETGGLFIGYLGLSLCSITVVISIFALTKVFTNWDEVEEIFHNMQIKKDLDHDPETVELFKHSKFRIKLHS